MSKEVVTTYSCDNFKCDFETTLRSEILSVDINKLSFSFQPKTSYARSVLTLDLCPACLKEFEQEVKERYQIGESNGS